LEGICDEFLQEMESAGVKKKLFIVIPAYQEMQVIASVIRELHTYGYRNIIIVDDGSEDNTFEEARKAGAMVLRHSMNRGKGAAVKTGIEAAKRSGADIVITFDGDGQNDPGDIKDMLMYMQRGYDVVLGNRFLHKQSIPFLKRIYNGVANGMTYLLYGIRVTDSQSGFRAYSRNAFDALDTESDRYEFDTEVLREIRVKKLKYKEIPVHVRYTKYSQAKAMKQTLWTGLETAFRLVMKA
jgi:UDP-N-acetylglucosamine---dolichyl-phosphate N-acetylglucosaminyltransferase